MAQKTLGIIGCGAIGTALATYAADKLTSSVGKIVLCDVDQDKAQDLAKKVGGADIAKDIKEIIDASDIVIEAVSPSVAKKVLKLAVENETDLMIMSIGGLLGEEELLLEAGRKGVNVMLPSGAIAGVDAVKAAKIAGIETATLTTRKPPASIKGAPYLEKNGIDVDAIKEETVIFEGNALEAMEAFPKNVNVSATLSLAGIGPEKTTVRIMVSPEYTRNSHEIEIIGKAGSVITRTENVPSPQNPKTSYMAALAAIAALEGYFNTVRVGT